MNREQRKFLITQVEKTCGQQIEDLEKTVPKEPSLNNHIIAAFMDNTIQFVDQEVLKKKIRENVIAMGKDEDIIVTDSKWRRHIESQTSYVKIKAEDFFIYPQSYIDAMNVYTEKRSFVDQEITKLEKIRDTIIMKIQIGSNQVLDRLIEQVDNMADLNIMNTQLRLEASGKEGIKRIQR